RMTKDLKHPRPGQEAVSAAFQAIQRLALEVDAEALGAEQSQRPTCGSCGADNRVGNRFCSSCGVPLQTATVEGIEVSPQALPPALPQGDHHYHHHYHHHYFSSTDGPGAPPVAETRPSIAGPRVRPAVGGLSRGEVAVRQLTQDWALACNSKHIDDLIGLYTVDATVMRPNCPAVRGASGIREFFCGLLEAGLGDVELEPL